MTKDCRNGVSCWKHTCTFQHPAGWSPCPNGPSCATPATCGYRQHPPACKNKDACRDAECQHWHPPTRYRVVATPPAQKTPQTPYQQATSQMQWAGTQKPQTRPSSQLFNARPGVTPQTPYQHSSPMQPPPPPTRPQVVPLAHLCHVALQPTGATAPPPHLHNHQAVAPLRPSSGQSMMAGARPGSTPAVHAFASTTVHTTYLGSQQQSATPNTTMQQRTTNQVVTQQQVVAAHRHLCIHIVVDISGSMAGERIKEAKQSVTDILNKIETENVRCHFRISTFNTAVTTLPLQNSPTGWGAYLKYKDEHRRNVESMAASGQTSLYDAIGEALDAMKKQMEYFDSKQKKAKYYTFVLTDGEDTSSSHVDPKMLNERVRYLGPKGYKLVIVSVTETPDANLAAIKGELTFVQLSNVAAASGNIKQHFGQMIVQEITRTVTTVQETVRMVNNVQAARPPLLR